MNLLCQSLGHKWARTGCKRCDEPVWSVGGGAFNCNICGRMLENMNAVRNHLKAKHDIVLPPTRRERTR